MPNVLNEGDQVDRGNETHTRLWKALQEAKVPQRYRKAAAIIENRGQARGTYYHRNTGTVDVTSAIALSFKVPENKLSDHWEDLREAAPERYQELLMESLRFAEGYVGEDLTKWNDQTVTDVKDITVMLCELADKLDAMGS